MNWRALVATQLPWLALVLLMRWRYRDLLREAIKTLRYVHEGLQPGMVRVNVREAIDLIETAVKEKKK